MARRAVAGSLAVRRPRPRFVARAPGALVLVAAVASASAVAAPSLGCAQRGAVSDVPDARESPQAKAEPAPLANAPPVVASAAAALANPEAGPPPLPMRGDVALPADAVLRDVAVYTLEAALRAIDVPPAVKTPELSAASIDAARRKTEPRFAIDLAAAHARIVLRTRAFVLPEDTELRARADRYGFVLLLPGEATYRVVAPGALRALLGERRIDVAPLSAATVTARGEGARRLGYRTRRVEASNRAGTVTFELARVPDVGEGGAIVCRALLDLMNAPPSTVVCGTDDVPLHADLRWSTRGGLTFDAFGLARRTDGSSAPLAAPPAGLTFAPPSLPGASSGVLLSGAELAAFRTGPAEVPVPSSARAEPPAGLALANGTDELRFLWIDGTPVVWVSAGARETLPSLLRGRYSLQWRTFLGDAVEPAQTVTVPGVAEIPAPEGHR